MEGRLYPLLCAILCEGRKDLRSVVLAGVLELTRGYGGMVVVFMYPNIIYEYVDM